MEDSTTETIYKKMEGDLWHATELLSTLWEFAHSDDNTANKVSDAATPRNTPPAVSCFRALTSHQTANAGSSKWRGWAATKPTDPTGTLAMRGVLSKDGSIKIPVDTLSPVSPPRFCLFVSRGSANFMSISSDHTGHEPRPLGFCEDCPHQVDS